MSEKQTTGAGLPRATNLAADPRAGRRARHGAVSAHLAADCQWLGPSNRGRVPPRRSAAGSSKVKRGPSERLVSALHPPRVREIRITTYVRKPVDCSMRRVKGERPIR